MKRIAIADSINWKFGDARYPHVGPAISTPDTASSTLPISDSVLLRGTHD